MPKYKVTHHGPFSTTEEIIEADSLEEAEEIAHLKSVYKYISVEEVE